MPLVTDSQRLHDICQELSQESYIAIDTEFLRGACYWPKLCLIQVAGKNNHYLIDPLAKDIDLTPLWELFRNPDILKVIHSGAQDVEIIYYATNHTITPLFDTQIAAMAIGFFEQTSYANLIKHFLGKDLDKTSQFSQWDRRPLNDKQLIYAANDVTYLYQAYPKIKHELTKRNRESWIDDEIAILTDTQTYTIDPDNVWKRLHMRSRTPAYTGILRALAKWREEQAMKKNLPRARILKDGIISDIADRAPKSPKALWAIPGTRHIKGEEADSLIATIEEGKANPIDKKELAAVPPALTQEQKFTIDLCRIALYVASSQNNIAEKLIINNADLTKYVTTKETNMPVFKTWRYEIFGQTLQKLCAGELSLGMHKGRLNFVK